MCENNCEMFKKFGLTACEGCCGRPIPKEKGGDSNG